MTDQTTFADLGLESRILSTLTSEGYTTPTAVQGQAIPALVEGKDLLGVAQTGTGKTAAFCLPLLNRLAAERARLTPTAAQALVLAPTRELAIQIEEACRTYSRGLGLRTAVAVGGVPKGKQRRALSGGVDVLIATPGRLMDLLREGSVRLDQVSKLILDEADRMLDMGFVDEVRQVARMTASPRQSMMFSATMPKAVERLANELLSDPARVEVSPKAPTAERIDQRVYHVAQGEKRGLLAGLLNDEALSRVLVFTRTKHGADKLSEQLAQGGVSTDALHGNKTQGARQHALNRFRKGNARVLVATDIAARGLDVDGVSHVVNYDLPDAPESYVHRIGRTARAGAEGVALSFCDPSERRHLRGIESFTRNRLTVIGEEPRGGDRRSDRGARGRPANGKPKGDRRSGQGQRRAA
ncbi:ATP-dependent RNA helicase RhlE [Limimonas halophila]|uniref:ATP-dependent RNA helicase RhlE n=1 Tax=Limimonas halophila TaxID=1082479 RepID=A0A1G7TUP0_9PROT|nr:DEAD/DEAH box helicase [Limimonas halophila]SDG38734.1 ATP-dependent RNA helicase RhlE [Limimonas halophila]